MNIQDLHMACLHIGKLNMELMNLYRLLEAAKLDGADGYPSRSMPEGSARNEVDADGVPVPQHPDPTANAVMARNGGQSGQLNAAIRQIESAFTGAYRILQSARGRTLNVLTPPAEAPVPDREDICVCCDNAVSATESQKAQRVKRWGRAHVHPELCDWCASFVVVHGRRPPKSLIRKHESGKRIYDRDVREALTV